MNEEELTELLRSPSVEYIEEDGILHASDVNGLSARSPISQYVDVIATEGTDVLTVQEPMRLGI